MKKLYFLFAALLMTVISMAQDVIILKDSTEIQALIQKTEGNVVVYQKYKNPTATNDTIHKREISMIKYANGKNVVFVKRENPNNQNVADVAQIIQNQYYLDELLEVRKSFWSGVKIYEKYGDERLSKSEIKQKMEVVPEAYTIYKSGRSMKNWANVLALPSGALLGWGIGSWLGAYTSGNPVNYGTVFVCMAGGLALLVSSYSLELVGNSKIRKAVEIYNDAKRNQYGLSNHDVNLRLGITPTGNVGLTLNF